MECLFEKTMILTPDKSKTNVELPFTVPNSYPALMFCTSYCPKSVNDPEKAKREIETALEKYIPEDWRSRYGGWEDYVPLVNLVTLSLDHNEHYIGCAHRHAPIQKHIISADFASPGFYRCSLTAGAWQAVINVHAVVSPQVHYELKVYGLTEEEAARERV